MNFNSDDVIQPQMGCGILCLVNLFYKVFCIILKDKTLQWQEKMILGNNEFNNFVVSIFRRVEYFALL